MIGNKQTSKSVSITEFLAPNVTPDAEGDAEGGDADTLLPLAGRRSDLIKKETKLSTFILYDHLVVNIKKWKLHQV